MFKELNTKKKQLHVTVLLQRQEKRNKIKNAKILSLFEGGGGVIKFLSFCGEEGLGT
jgi:hypothetical protein